jgi:hypothetical protein
MGDANPEDEDDGQQATPQANQERHKGRYRRGEQAGSRPPARTPTAHSTGSVKPAAIQASSAAVPAVVAPEGDPESIEQSKNTALSPEGQTSQAVPVSQAVDAATEGASGADRPRGSTKRAKLITMLERAEGASVAEIGQHLGWLPHTVRAAITGLRHTDREVTRSKDAAGQSVYRLAPVETARDR